MPSRAFVNLLLNVASADGRISKASSLIGPHSRWWVVNLSTTGNRKGSGKQTCNQIEVLGLVQLGDMSNVSWFC
jgi:hypothetical protein